MNEAAALAHDVTLDCAVFKPPVRRIMATKATTRFS